MQIWLCDLTINMVKKLIFVIYDIAHGVQMCLIGIKNQYYVTKSVKKFIRHTVDVHAGFLKYYIGHMMCSYLTSL